MCIGVSEESTATINKPNVSDRMYLQNLFIYSPHYMTSAPLLKSWMKEIPEQNVRTCLPDYTA